MINLQVTDLNFFYAFWLVFCRWGAMMLQFPLFDQNTIPLMIKVLLVVGFSFAIFPMLQGVVVRDVVLVGTENIWFLTIFYTLMGLLVGFLAKSILFLFNSVGAIITQQIGFTSVRYFDPNSGDQVGPFERIIFLTMTLILISSGGLLPLLKGGMASFQTMSFLTISSKVGIVQLFTHLFKSVFLSAILLSMPFIFSNILVMSILGIISRAVPQMNILMVSFVLNIGVGLLIFLFSSEEFFILIFEKYSSILGDWFRYIK